ncbi:MAG: uroporphyrinogen decarboxylase [Mangrovibacterium sp.]
MQQSVFLDTLKGKIVSRPPVWFMRQAGRVLPNYNRLKQDHTFRELMNDPKLAARVTLLPVQDLGVDAAILFSDILIIPEAMGMKVDYTEQGPVFRKPLKSAFRPAEQLNPLPEKLDPVYAAIREIIKTRPGHIPLIGFCGAPLTTLCYMMEGISTHSGFPSAVRFLYTKKKEARMLIRTITEFSIHYALQQIENGIEAFQLFDTHAGLIPEEMYLELFMPAIQKLSLAVRSTGTPFIFFPKGFGSAIRHITPDITDFVSIDWQIPLPHARELVHPEVGLQGNLDPRQLYSPKKEIRKALEKYLPFFRNNAKWIFNLGHGFLQDTPFEHAKYVVEWIKRTHW